MAMFATPLKAVLRARRDKTLGDLNPMPFPAILANCVGWIAYAYVVRDWYVWVPNEIGFLLGSFYTLSCFGLLDTKGRDWQIVIFMFFAALLTIVGAIGALCNLSHHALRLLWGFTSNAILLVYYTAPLSTIYKVIKTRNSSSLYWPLSVMNVVNGTLWLAYGLAVTDYFIWVPNGTGAILAAFTLVLIWMFPSKGTKSRRSPASSDSGTSLEPAGSLEQLAGASSGASKIDLIKSSPIASSNQLAQQGQVGATQAV